MAKVKAEGVDVICIDIMCIDDRVDVMSGVLGKLGLHRSFKKPKKLNKAGQKLTPLMTRHGNSGIKIRHSALLHLNLLGYQ